MLIEGENFETDGVGRSSHDGIWEQSNSKGKGEGIWEQFFLSSVVPIPLLTPRILMLINAWKNRNQWGATVLFFVDRLVAESYRRRLKRRRRVTRH